MEFNDTGIILRMGRFREADLWVRFLSPSRGIITAFAFGGCRSRRRFCGCLDHLNHIAFRVRSAKGGAYQSLEEGQLIASPSVLRKDYNRLGVLVNCQKFLEAMGVSSEGALAAFSLFSETTDMLERSDSLDSLWPLLFRLRFAFDQGYQLETSVCLQCGTPLSETAHIAVNVREGVLFCATCPPSSGPIARISQEALDALRFVQENSPFQWPLLRLSELGRKELSRVADGFIQFHIGLAWDRGMFRRV